MSSKTAHVAKQYLANLVDADEHVKLGKAAADSVRSLLAGPD